MSDSARSSEEPNEVACSWNPVEVGPRVDPESVGSRTGSTRSWEAGSRDGFKMAACLPFRKEGRADVCRRICENLRHNLDGLRHDEKETFVRETQALYLSVLDAAVHGPARVSTPEAATILGVSRHSVRRVKTFRMIQVNRTRKGSKERRVLTQKKWTHKGNGSEDDVASQPAWRLDATTTPRRSRPWWTRSLKDQFTLFATFGSRGHDGRHITLSQSDKWMKQAGVVDGRTLTTTDTGILFRKMSPNHVWMTFGEWHAFVQRLADDKDVDEDAFREALVLCGPPTGCHTTDPDQDGLLDRLTDVHLYGGTHRRRFDAAGRGRGLLGRRDAADVLSLHRAAPSPEGLLPVSPKG